ncbi:unnamed protein product [Schistocephalus solidus]|uniref:DUF4819 domain-containing protein n=1 Tax=Schistocephalus solidus TaxID=70667 RepID=A0A183T0T5_SCHSO|nr:unnamed protein product [Schistocephalus solidus]
MEKIREDWFSNLGGQPDRQRQGQKSGTKVTSAPDQHRQCPGPANMPALSTHLPRANRPDFDLRLSMYKQRVANCACEGGPRLEPRRHIEIGDKLCASSSGEVNGSLICRSDVFPFEKTPSTLSPCFPNDRLSPPYEHYPQIHLIRHRSESSHMNYPKTQTTATDTGLPHSIADSSVCHNCDKPVCSAPSKVSFSVACSTHHEDNGDYVIHLDEPVLVAGDVRIKIRAKVGVLPKVPGSRPLVCVLLYDAFSKRVCCVLYRLFSPCL